jgi:hypothetical protein
VFCIPQDLGGTGDQMAKMNEVEVGGEETDPGVKEIEAFGVQEWFARQAAGYSPVPAKQDGADGQILDKGTLINPRP